VINDTSLVLWLSGGILLSLLAAATLADFARRRIPNIIVLAGLLLGLALNTFAPEGFGLFNRYGPGGLGLLAGLGGVLVGGFLSPWHALWAGILVLLAGGILSLSYALQSGVLPKAWSNIRLLFIGAFSSFLLRDRPSLSVDTTTAGHVPYGLAISLGTVAYLLLQYQGWLAV